MTRPEDSARVTAVVCNYNGADYIEECLTSVLAQPEVDEVIVVDDASEDGSAQQVRVAFPGVEVVVLDRNRGPGAARNEGVRRARNAYVLTVDNDAVLRPDVVARLLAALRADPRRGAAQPRSVIYDEPDRVHYDAGRFHYVGLLALRNFYAHRAEAEGEGVVETDMIMGICPLFDRAAFLAIGGFDETFFYLAEDFDLALRMRQAGYGVVVDEEAIVLHKGGTAGLSFRGGGYPTRRAYLHSRNRWFLIAKNYSLRTIVVALPGILVYEAVWLLFTLGQGHFLVHVKGKIHFLRGLPGMLRQRREVQARRRVRDRDLLVGGPLTFSPSLVAKPAARLAARTLDRILAGWWVLVRRLSG